MLNYRVTLFAFASMAWSCATQTLDAYRNAIGAQDVDHYPACQGAIVPRGGNADSCQPALGTNDWVEAERDYSLPLAEIDADADKLKTLGYKGFVKSVGEPIAKQYLLRAFDTTKGGLQGTCADASVAPPGMQVYVNGVAFAEALEKKIEAGIDAGIKAAAPTMEASAATSLKIKLLAKYKSGSKGILLHVSAFLPNADLDDKSIEPFSKCYDLARAARAINPKNGSLVLGFSGFALLGFERQTEALSQSDVSLALVGTGTRTDSLAANLSATINYNISKEFSANVFAAQPSFHPVWMQFGPPTAASPWIYEEVSDCAGSDISPTTPRALPDRERCTRQTQGTVAVCWDGATYSNSGDPNAAFCTYKTQTADSCKKGRNPGRMYSCSPPP